ncbi:hypothetical protein BX616_005564 [Lobosporangium transversale]|nr:hypothetical protein BX616_005564 [Lobosporangium transversale]
MIVNAAFPSLNSALELWEIMLDIKDEGTETERSVYITTANSGLMLNQLENMYVQAVGTVAFGTSMTPQGRREAMQPFIICKFTPLNALPGGLMMKGINVQGLVSHIRGAVPSNDGSGEWEVSFFIKDTKTGIAKPVFLGFQKQEDIPEFCVGDKVIIVNAIYFQVSRHDGRICAGPLTNGQWTFYR